MKNKILETNISAALETIARALRNYSGEPLTCHLFVETREKVPEEGTDFYAFEVRKNDEVIRETYNCFGGRCDGTD